MLRALVQDPSTTLRPVGDTTADARIRWITVALVALAFLVLAVTVWFWRVTRPIDPLLEPLDALGRDGRRRRRRP